MIDLGKWASEDYRMPLAETPEGLTPAEFLDIDFDTESSSDEQR